MYSVPFRGKLGLRANEWLLNRVKALAPAVEAYAAPSYDNDRMSLVLSRLDQGQRVYRSVPRSNARIYEAAHNPWPGRQYDPDRQERFIRKARGRLRLLPAKVAVVILLAPLKSLAERLVRLPMAHQEPTFIFRYSITIR